MPSRGTSEPLSALIGILLMLVIIVPLAVITYNIMKDHPDVRAPVFYNQLIQHYQDCISQETTDCYCDELDFSLLPQTEVIKLRQLTDNKLAIELWKANGDKPIQTTEIQGKELCTAYFTFGDLIGRKDFKEKAVSLHSILSDSSYTRYTRYYLTIYNGKTAACFINHAGGLIGGGEPSYFAYKRSGPGIPPLDNADGLIKEYLTSCKDKKIQQSKTTEPKPSNDLF